MAGLISVFGVLLWRWAYPGKLLLRQRFAMILIIFSGLLVFAMLQSRASYVFIILATGLLIVIGGQGRQLSFLMGFVALCAVVLFAFEISGLEFKGRVGKLTLSGISDHVLTLSGQSSNADFNGAAAGISQRKAWRAYSLGLWSHSIETQILGVGFGRTLTDLGFIGENGEKLLVQDPHNSYVTILTRSGLLGLSMMLSMFVWVFYMAIVGYRRLRNKHRPAAAFFLCVALFHLYCMINAWGEPHFEVTHYIITAFFTYGVTWAVWDKFFNAKKPAS
jgi:O-antigen ligase